MARSKPIRMLMDMRHIAHTRNEAVEVASKAGDYLGTEWADSSRIWSRQGEALTLAIIGEPPTDTEDVVSVLGCLAELRNLHNEAEDQSPFCDRDMTEMTDVAIHNCIAALAGSAATSTEQDDFNWSVKQVARWLPEGTERPSGVDGGQHAIRLAERNRLHAALNSLPHDASDTAAEPLYSALNEAESWILDTPASTEGEAKTKLRFIATLWDEGSVLDRERAAAIIAEIAEVLA